MDAWQELEELRQQLARLAMVGRVSDVNEAKRQVRVIWPASGETSGWLFVLQHSGAGLDIKPDGGHTHEITDTYTGGGSASVEPDHKHSGGSTVTVWLPKINELVLVLYLPVFGGDGFVLGSVGGLG